MTSSGPGDAGDARPVDDPPPTGEVTRLLGECASGDRSAFERLVPLVYDDLRGIAHRRLRSEREGHTLSTTALVHEAYLHLVDQATATWQDRAHFFAVAATVIRQVLIDYARSRGAQKRGGGAVRIPLRDELVGEEPRMVELLALEEALAALARYDSRLERVVECRFFGGMSARDTAAALDVSQRTVERDWARAKAHLYRTLASESAPENGQEG
jgi:RNA polymerase sigma factor (TIGR02999 family)